MIVVCTYHCTLKPSNLHVSFDMPNLNREISQHWVEGRLLSAVLSAKGWNYQETSWTIDEPLLLKHIYELE